MRKKYEITSGLMCRWCGQVSMEGIDLAHAPDCDADEAEGGRDSKLEEIDLFSCPVCGTWYVQAKRALDCCVMGGSLV